MITWIMTEIGNYWQLLRFKDKQDILHEAKSCKIRNSDFTDFSKETL